MDKKSSRWWLAVILFSQAALSVAFVFFRIIDADEGFYLAACQRTADGLLLYRDFFFPQMPLLPLIFSVFSGWGISSLLLLRVVSAAVSLLTTCLVYVIVRRNTGERGGAIGAVCLIAFCGLSLTWHSVFKPYAYVDLFLLLSFGCLVMLTTSGRRNYLMLFFSMFFLAVAFNFRSVFVVLIPVYMYIIYHYGSTEYRNIGRGLLLTAIALLLPSIPAIVLLIKSGSNFWFNNLIFHLHREPIEPLSALFAHKALVVGKFLVLPQTIILVGLSIGSLFLLRSRLVEEHKLYRLAIIMVIVIGVVYLLPTPIHLQYFQQIIPYLVIAAVPALIYLSHNKRFKMLSGMGVVLYIAGIVPFLFLFLLSPRDKDKRFTWPQIRDVISKIEENSAQGDTLLSEWAGYAALSARPQLPGSEHVGFHFPLEIAQCRYEQNHLLTDEDIFESLNQKRPKLVIIDYRITPAWESPVKLNYHLACSIGETFIYKRNNESI